METCLPLGVQFPWSKGTFRVPFWIFTSQILYTCYNYPKITERSQVRKYKAGKMAENGMLPSWYGVKKGGKVSRTSCTGSRTSPQSKDAWKIILTVIIIISHGDKWPWGGLSNAQRDHWMANIMAHKVFRVCTLHVGSFSLLTYFCKITGNRSMSSFSLIFIEGDIQVYPFFTFRV